jgi:hypothetical protein
MWLRAIPVPAAAAVRSWLAPPPAAQPVLLRPCRVLLLLLTGLPPQQLTAWTRAQTAQPDVEGRGRGGGAGGEQ